MAINIRGKEICIDKSNILVLLLTVLKLILMGLFSSDYQNELFIPFTSYFVENGGNVYQYFYNIGKQDVFPYPTVMLLVESAGVVIMKTFRISSIFMSNLVFKLPSLIFDFIGLHFIIKMFPDKRKYAVVFYFGSPIILYAVYMHGQLDLIPTVLLLCSVYYLSSKHRHGYILGGGLLVCALLSKLHILAALPIIFIYLYKRDGMKNALRFSISAVCVTAIGMLPFLSEGFMEIVLFNTEQSVLTQVMFRLSTVEVYIPVMAVLIVYLVAFGINVINRDLFISFCGITFAIFLALCPPMPGWYVWIVPYVTMFFMGIDESRYKNILIYILLNSLYIVYFVLLHSRSVVDLYLLNTDLSCLKMHNEVLSNLFFTLLAGTLTYIVFSMFQLGITSNSLYKRRNIPFTIGIAGDSGSGKTSFIDIVASALGEDNLLFIEGDGDHRWERGERHWEEYTHLNPKANYLYRQAHDLQQLRQGGAVKRIEYDHDTGKFTNTKKVRPKKYTMLCGLHALYLPQTRKNMDLGIYMDVDETLRRYWKIQRDITNRGYSKEKILRQIEDRVSDAERYIYPQKKYADMVIRYYDKTLKDCTENNHEVKLSVCITISAAINIEPLVKELTRYGVNVTYDYSEDLQMQVIDLSAEKLGGGMRISVEKIADKIIPQIEEITREGLGEEKGIDGILKLFLLLLISNKMREEI